MRIERTIAAALAVAAAVLIVGGTAFAGGEGNGAGSATLGERCQARLERMAERQGITVAELETRIRARAHARIQGALAADKISAELAAKLEERLAAGRLCMRPRAAVAAKLGTRFMLAGAASYLGFTRAELRAELKGTSLAELAQAQGKSVAGLKTAMLARADARLTLAVERNRMTQAQADRVLDRLERRVDRLVTRVFPAG